MKMPRQFRRLPEHVVMLSAVLMLMFVGSTFASGPLEKVVYSFPLYSGTGTSLAADKAGNLYGVKGAGVYCARDCGIVFQLSPPVQEGGEWVENDIYTFPDPVKDGCNPVGPLIFDKAGNIYGTTFYGGVNNSGSVFRLTPPTTPGEHWYHQLLFSFEAGRATSGELPQTSLVLDSRGNLYGTTSYQGLNQCETPYDACGTVFKLSPSQTEGGSWIQTVLHEFADTNTDGYHPLTGLVIDHHGALYGTTASGGTNSNGTVYQLVVDRGVWTYNTIYNFPKGPIGVPVGGLVVDSDGNLYGTGVDVKSYGENEPCVHETVCGGVIELSPPSAPGEPWRRKTLYKFSGGKDGANPIGNLLFDKLGNLYGATWGGGLKNKSTQNNGTIFELSPPAMPGGEWTETTLHEFGGQTYNDGRWPAGSLVMVAGKFYGSTLQGGSTDWGVVFSLTIVPSTISGNLPGAAAWQTAHYE